MDKKYQHRPDVVLDDVRTDGDDIAALGLSISPIMVARAERLHATHARALTRPELFVRGSSRSDDLAHRSIRAELAAAMGESENVVGREIEIAEVLVEHLPATRAALSDAKVLWRAGVIICETARVLPAASRAEFDTRATELALTLTPTQLRPRLRRLRDEIDEQPLDERHTKARTDRHVRLIPEEDGMCTLTALLPAQIAVGAYNRLDRIARALRDDDPDGRTLDQLRADALGDLLTDGDVSGSTPNGTTRTPTFVPGIRADVRVTIPVLTAAGVDDAPADLDGYGPIPADVARELLGTVPSFFRVLTDPVTGHVRCVDRTSYTPPASMRRFLQLRDQTCRFPGCTRTTNRAELDHTIEWRNGGRTSTDNLAHLCTSHHHVRHGDRWNYTLHTDGTADWTTPTGRHVTTSPPPAPGCPRALRLPRFVDSTPHASTPPPSAPWAPMPTPEAEREVEREVEELPF